uniref:Uncharacterized protein LOC111132694 n=1 Tax=Crassostrea virginica TaxID=6565 RepID=A0A8B8E9G8_CRAVI|nr:uncharacterized protein LOC111132694 [Crassostrea virginica]
MGMIKNAEAKVTRYSKAGKEQQNIQRDNQGQELYSCPHFITENINGDICTSDFGKHAVVVVNNSGQHWFSYTGQGTREKKNTTYGGNYYTHEIYRETVGTNQRETRGEKTLSLSSSVTKVREYSVPGIDSVYHVSVDKSGRLWVSDERGNLVQTDLQGNLLQKIQTCGEDEGYHTATQDGDLMYTDKDKRVIYKITPDRKITEFIKTGDWRPLSVHSSRINGDILVGMVRKITRCSKAGKKIQNIQRDNQGEKLYEWPHYITENINGDICTSDCYKQAVVVDGGFLSVILSSQQGVELPCGVCVDDENNLHVGQRKTNIVTVYKFLQ